MYTGKMHDGIMCNTIFKFSFFSSVVTVTKAVAPEPYPFLTLLFYCSTLHHCQDCSMPGFPVLHHLLEFAQTHAHWVSDAIQLSYPLSPTSPPALNLSQHQGLFQWVGSLYLVAKVLELQFQHQFFQRILNSWFPLGLTGWISLLSKGFLRAFFNITVQKNQFFSAQPSLSSNSHIHIWLLEKP